MEITKTQLDGLLIIQPKIFFDSRGYFFESYKKNVFSEMGMDMDFVQDNESLSQKNVLRGLHFQNPPFAQSKLVRVIKGSVLDVVVDIRKKSSTYGKHFSLELTEENKTMLFVPEGFAHGFATLKDDTIFSYKCSTVYSKEVESCILWNDPYLKIDWVISNPTLSEKDKTGKRFKDLNSLF